MDRIDNLIRIRVFDNLMSNPVKNTQSDMMLIGMILVGCTKLILSRKLTDRELRVYAKARSHLQIKPLVRTFIITNLSTITKNKKEFHPLDIKEKLPEEWRIIDPADLTRILQDLVRINAIISIPNPIGKWGRPTEENIREAGIKSLYRISDYYNNLEKVLAKPKAIKLIYSLLFESGLLYHYLVQTTLISYYIAKNKDFKTARNILRSINVSFKIRDSELETEYDKIRYTNSHTQLKQIAEEKARLRVERGGGSDHITLYLQGGLAFRSYTQSTVNHTDL